MLEDAIEFIQTLAVSRSNDRLDNKYLEYEERLEEKVDEDSELFEMIFVVLEELR